MPLLLLNRHIATMGSIQLVNVFASALNGLSVALHCNRYNLAGHFAKPLQLFSQRFVGRLSRMRTVGSIKIIETLPLSQLKA